MGFDGRKPGDNPALDEIERLRVELAAEREANEALRQTINMETELQSQLQAELAAAHQRIKELEADNEKQRKRVIKWVNAAHANEEWDD